MAVLSAPFGSAQPKSIRASIPFQFTVEKAVLPAGQYVFRRNSANDDVINIVSDDKGPSAVALAVTRLGAGVHTTLENAHVVFDKVGNDYFLSEVWFPEIDGYLLRVTKGKHEHRTVDVKS